MSLHHFPKHSFPRNDSFKNAHARAVQASNDRFRKNAQATHDRFLKSSKAASDRFQQSISDRNRRRCMAPASGSGAVLVLLIVGAFFAVGRIPCSGVNTWLVRNHAPASVAEPIDSALYAAKKAESTTWAEIARLQRAAASDPLLQADLKRLKLQLKQAEDAFAHAWNSNSQNANSQISNTANP